MVDIFIAMPIYTSVFR